MGLTFTKSGLTVRAGQGRKGPSGYKEQVKDNTNGTTLTGSQLEDTGRLEELDLEQRQGPDLRPGWGW